VLEDAELSAIPAYVSDDRARRSQSRGSLGAQRDARTGTESRYDSRHDYRLDPRSIDTRHRDMDRPGPGVPPLHDREIPLDRDAGYYRGGGGGGGERMIGYDRVRIDHVDLSRPPPPLPFRGPCPPLPDRLPTRGSSDRLDEYHRDVDRHDRGGLLRPPNWERTDRYPRDDWETRYSHDQPDRRGAAEEYREGPPPEARGDRPRIKTEEPTPQVDKTREATATTSRTVYAVYTLTFIFYFYHRHYHCHCSVTLHYTDTSSSQTVG